jgi:hypothetical protein
MMFGFAARGIVLAAGLSAGVGAPQAQESSLTRALALFNATDSNHDGKLSADETRVIPVSADAFGAEDADRDGFWSRDEFLVFYRHQLVASRQPVGADLEAEIARIQALKRVEAVDPAKKPRCETSARSVDAFYVNQRIDAILVDLESKCAAHRATRDDFQRLRNLVVLNGRVASRDAGAPSSESQVAILSAIDRIEKRSAQGLYPRDDFESLRRARLATATAPAPKSPTSTPPETPKPAPTTPQPNPTPPRRDPTPPTPPLQTQSGPAAARQRPVPTPAPKPHPAPPRPGSDPPDRSKP